MAKPQRGLPASFTLDLPDNVPSMLGDYLDESPPPLPVARRIPAISEPQTPLRSEVTVERRVAQSVPVPGVRGKRKDGRVRYQLNLTPRSKLMLEEIVKHVQSYGPESNATTSEVFHGIMGLVHSSLSQLELSDVPGRGAWGSVTSKNFPIALGDAFERAIVKSAKAG